MKNNKIKLGCLYSLINTLSMIEVVGTCKFKLLINIKYVLLIKQIDFTLKFLKILNSCEK